MCAMLALAATLAFRRNYEDASQPLRHLESNNAHVGVKHSFSCGNQEGWDW